MKLVLSCEHATNNIPPKYSWLFMEAVETLNSHRGYDPGALNLFSKLISLSDANFKCEISRLLVEVNRSIGHPALFSEFTLHLSPGEKNEILNRYYYPYRNEVEKNIAEIVRKGEKVFHFSIHSFTPIFNGEQRNADIGLLYDPQREVEKEFCRNFRETIQSQNPELKIRFNYPYLGIADGFTTSLRKKFQKNYIGIEIEVNQKLVTKNIMKEKIKTCIFSALEQCLEKK